MAEKGSDDRLKTLFKEYYDGFVFRGPDLLSSREIGFIPFSGTMIRHRKFDSSREISAFFKTNVPRHAYYSTAYYRKADEKIMKDKEWLGAELIFDLDADHIPGADKLSYEQILQEVKKHTVRLIKKFLIGDFGFSEEDLKIYFSGGRGYHVHVVSDRVYEMNSNARREIADFIRGEGLEVQDFKRNMSYGTPKEGGWVGKIDQALAQFYSYLDRSENEGREALKDILGGKPSAEAYLESLHKFPRTKNAQRIKIETFKEKGREKYRMMDARDLKVLNFIMSKVKTENMAEIDEPVTTDVHRLIRFPYSLHGKTGLMVLELNLSELEEFDPLSGAIPGIYMNEEDDVILNKQFAINLNKESFRLSPGRHRVPRYLAVFMCAFGVAQFIDGTY